jgi:glycosyltransferase involved in cell wall biosynthesis
MKKVHFHFYVDSADPTTGGTGVSANRLVSHLLAMGRTRVTIYERSDIRHPRAISSGAEIVTLFDSRVRIMAPFQGSDVLAEASEVYRAAFVVFRAAIRPRIARTQDYRHILLSFYISAAGFVAQQVADELGLPHIASVRGTDFNKDFRSPYRIGGVRYVLERAASVVTTSKAQESVLRPFVGERTRIRTIYNSAEPSRKWARTRLSGEALRIFSDTGFSYKKGSHILLDAVDSALLAGHQVQLTVAGGIDPAALEYWTAQKRQRKEAQPANFVWLNHISREEVASALTNADVYCSASLGEGASNGLTQAMVDGLPIVATDIGAFAELAPGADHVASVPAGDSEAYACALSRMLSAVSVGGLAARKETLEDWRRLLSPTRELCQWQEVVAEILERGPSA